MISPALHFRASPVRGGSILILVAGLTAMLAVLATTFLVRMRQDAEESNLVVQAGQCRLMLHAGMQFIQEASRVGYATSGNRSVEGWGWIDVRDGAVGPRGNNREILRIAGRVPAPGTLVVRAPMFMHKLPPFAVVPHMYPNQIPSNDDPAVDPNFDRTFGIPVLARPDPAPALPAVFSTHDPASAAQRSAWETGDATPDTRSLGLSWFRVYREDGSEAGRPAAAGGRAADGTVAGTFIITVGAGGTQGFQDWAEVVREGETATFGEDPGTFDVLLAAELRQWFRVAWSGSVGGAENRAFNPLDPGGFAPDSFDNAYHARIPLNSSRYTAGGKSMSSAEPRNYVGTITYIQRLLGSPTDSKW